MYDPRRLVGLLVGLISLLAVLGVCGLFLLPIVSGHPRWLPDADSLCDVRDFRMNVSRVGGAIREARDRGDAGIGRLGLLIGSSSLEWGVDAARMPPIDEGPPMVLAEPLGHGLDD